MWLKMTRMRLMQHTKLQFAHWFVIKPLHSKGHWDLVWINHQSLGSEVVDNENGFGQCIPSNGTVKLNHLKIDSFLIFWWMPAWRHQIIVVLTYSCYRSQKRHLPTYSVRYKTLVDCGYQCRKSQWWPLSLQEIGKSNVLFDEATKYLDQLDAVNVEQTAKASILGSEAKIYAHDAGGYCGADCFGHADSGNGRHPCQPAG